MTAQPVTLRVLRHTQIPELSELSTLAIIWGIARAIAEVPPDALDHFLGELTGSGASTAGKGQAGA